jgi:Zn-dependent protease/CBS domain-containing protein
MQASVKLGRIWGIPIGLHSSWFLIFGLVTWSMAQGFYPNEFPSLPARAYWILGGLTSLLFFASVLLHELGHAYSAIRNNIPVNSITLFMFGGVAQIARQPESPGAEFVIAIAGPLTSLALAGLFGALWLADRSMAMLAAPSLWLARINFALAAFNMIPGFPLDGGRILRAIVWAITGSYHRATQVASFTGQLAAFGFIGVGVFTIFGGNFFNGIWLAFIGWFMQNAAAAAYQQVNLQKSLIGVTVSQVMTADCARIPSSLLLQQLVEEHILTGGQRCFFVEDGDQFRGMLTLADVTGTPRAQWGQVTAAQVMQPVEQLARVDPDAELLAALQKMDDREVNQVPVVDGNLLLGMISREQVLRYVRLRADLGF